MDSVFSNLEETVIHTDAYAIDDSKFKTKCNGNKIDASVFYDLVDKMKKDKINEISCDFHGRGDNFFKISKMKGFYGLTYNYFIGDTEQQLPAVPDKYYIGTGIPRDGMLVDDMGNVTSILGGGSLFLKEDIKKSLDACSEFGEALVDDACRKSSDCFEKDIEKRCRVGVMDYIMNKAWIAPPASKEQLQQVRKDAIELKANLENVISKNFIPFKKMMLDTFVERVDAIINTKKGMMKQRAW